MRSIVFSLIFFSLGIIPSLAQLNIELLKSYDSLEYLPFTISGNGFVVNNDKLPFVFSDGTANGTVALFEGDARDSRKFIDNQYLILDNYMVFTKENGIWLTDGTTAGARRVLEIPVSSQPEKMYINLFHINNKVLYRYYHYITRSDAGESLSRLEQEEYHRANVPNEGEIWELDLTTGASSLVIDINPGDGDIDFIHGDDGGSPTKGIVVNYRLLFNGSTTDAGDTDIWSTDGTALRTFPILEHPLFFGNAATSTPVSRSYKIDTQDFFNTYNSLYSSNGTPSGTGIISNDLQLCWDNPIEANDRLYFFSCNNTQLWTTQGHSNTMLIKELVPSEIGVPCNERSVSNTLYGTCGNDRHLYGLGNKLFFYYHSDATGFEPWISDGITSGTRLLHDINPSINDSHPSYITTFKDNLYFWEHNTQSIWVVVSRPSSTIMYVMGTGLFPNRLTKIINTAVFKDKLYILRKTYNRQYVLLETDGTYGSDARRVANFVSKDDGIDIQPSITMDRFLIKTTSPADGAVSLWQLNLTTKRVSMINTPDPRFTDVDFSTFHEDENHVYFEGKDRSGTRGLYKIWRSGSAIQVHGLNLGMSLVMPQCERPFEGMAIRFSYHNPDPFTISIPIGEDNFMEGIDEHILEGIDLPTEFLPGFHYIDFEIDGLEKDDRIAWTVKEKDGTISASQLVIPASPEREILYDGLNGGLLPPTEITPNSASIPFRDVPCCGEDGFRISIRSIYNEKGTFISVKDPGYYLKEIDIPKKEIKLGELFEIEGLTPGVTYEYHMTTLVNGQVGDYGIGQQFTTPSENAKNRQGNITYETDISDTEENEVVRLYPNPASETLTVAMPNGDSILGVTVFTSTGKKLIAVEADASLKELDISQLAKGMYLLRVECKERTITKKFLKH